MAEVATLEGGVASCVAVKRTKTGCTCARYGPAGSGPGFVHLCRRAGLPVRVGTTDLGDTMSKRSLSQPPLDYPPIEDLEYGFLAGVIPTAEQFKESLMVAGGAAGSVLVGSFVLPKLYAYLPDMLNKPLVKAAITLGIAIVGGGFAFRYSPQLAVGIVGGLGGLALAQAVGGLANIPINLGFGELHQELHQSLPEDEELLGLPPSGGTEDVAVETRKPYELQDALSSVEVEVERPLGGGAGIEGWLSAASQPG